MHSVGRTTETGDLARGGGVTQREPAAAPVPPIQQYGGNRAFAALVAGAQPAPVVVARPANAPASLDDPQFNATTRAHDLVRAVNSSEHTVAFKNATPMGGLTEDKEAERRQIDFPVALAALDGLTASQVQRVEEIYLDFDKTTLRSSLFGLGESGRRAQLTPDQSARLEALMRGTKAEPLPASVMAELRGYPPEIAGQLLADLEARADAEPALHRHQAEAAELHGLLASDLDEARRERLMAMHRRSFAEIDAVDALYEKEHGKGSLTRDLNLRLTGLQLMRMTELREGKFAQADACAIEDKRRQIEALNKADEITPDGLLGDAMSLASPAYDALKDQRRKQKQQLTGDIQAIVELNKQEALQEAKKSGRESGEAVGERLRSILGQQDGEAGHTLGSELERTLVKEDAAVLAAASDPWNSAGSANLVRAAAAQLVADEKAGTTSTKRITATLRSFRELAEHDLTAQAYDPRVPAAQKQAILKDSAGSISRLAGRYIEDYQSEYNKLRGEKGRTYDEIVASADKADSAYLRVLANGSGETSVLGELDHAMGKKDVDAVKAILRKLPDREAVDKLIADYDHLGDGRDLRRQLFGTNYIGETASPELAQMGNPMMVKGGLVTARDAAQVAEQLIKPTAAELASRTDAHGAESRWLAAGGRTEYNVTMDHRGLTGRAREIGDDPETERLLVRTKNDLAALAKQVEAETNPDKRARLVAEMRKLRATLTGDADAYEKDNERVLGEIRSALSFAVSIALAVVIPGAGPGLVAFLQTTALNIAANVASNFVIKMGDYTLDDLKADVLGGALGAGGAKFGEELMGTVASAIMRPAADATAETASKLGVRTVLAGEVGKLAGAGEKTVIAVEQFEVRTAGREAAVTITEVAAGTTSKSMVETAAREIGAFGGSMEAPKIMTGDFSLSIDEVLKALAATAAGKIAHRQKPGTVDESVKKPGSGEEPEGPCKPQEEEAAGAKHEESGGLPAGGAFIPEPAPPNADVFGPRSPKQMLLDNGIPPASAHGFQEVADGFNVILKVRPTNTASLPVLEAGGVAKPELIKAKTVNRTDILIGGPRDGVGKVGFFEPRMPAKEILDVLAPDARKAVEDRFAQRAEEFAHYKDEYGKLADEGLLRMKDGVLQIADPRTKATPEAPRGEFKDIGGDHDLFEITNADGSPLPHDVRRALVNQLRSMGINVEHADHVSWPADSPGTHDPAADQKIRDQHATKEPLVAFVPKSQPREVMAGDPVTGPERIEGAGDRHLPMSGGQASERTPAGRSKPGETDFSVEPRKTTPEEIAAAKAPEPAQMRPGRGGAGRRTSEPDAVAHRMAAAMHEVLADWPAIPSAQLRAERLLRAVGEYLKQTGAPMPKIKPISGENSKFHTDSWLVELGHPALGIDRPTIEQFAEVCDHVRHEWEHVVLDFRVVRREHALTGETADQLSDRLTVQKDVVQAAIEANRSGRFEPMDAAMDVQADKIQQSLRGTGKADRQKINDRLTDAEAALEEARANNDAEAESKALEIYNKAHAEYMDLPDEVHAWEAGRQLAEAVHRHQKLASQIADARAELLKRDQALAGNKNRSKRAVERLEEAVGTAETHLKELLELMTERTGKKQKL